MIPTEREEHNHGRIRRLKKSAPSGREAQVSSRQMELRAREAGKRAALRGSLPKDNPFLEKSLFHMFWRDTYDTEVAKIKKSKK